jgi:hypothetical protein
MEELVAYDPHLVVGILGGSAGTTYDAFKLIAEAQKYGARAALFGRKINSAECQLAFVELLRRITDYEITPEEAVRAYHGVLEKLKIKPHRSLADDMQLQTAVMSYGGSARAIVPKGIERIGAAKVAAAANGKGDCGCGGPGHEDCHCDTQPKAEQGHALNGKPVSKAELPDFAAMTRAEKLAYNQAKRDRVFG